MKYKKFYNELQNNWNYATRGWKAESANVFYDKYINALLRTTSDLSSTKFKMEKDSEEFVKKAKSYLINDGGDYNA